MGFIKMGSIIICDIKRIIDGNIEVSEQKIKMKPKIIKIHMNNSRSFNRSEFWSFISYRKPCLSRSWNMNIHLRPKAWASGYYILGSGLWRIWCDQK